MRAVRPQTFNRSAQTLALRRIAATPPPRTDGNTPGCTREQQLQMIVELGHRAHGGARSTHRIGLLDGDGRRNALDAIDLRSVHAVEELTRVGRESLDVAALAFGVQRVEHQRGLARSGHAGDDDQLVPGISSKFLRLFWRAPRSRIWPLPVERVDFMNRRFVVSIGSPPKRGIGFGSAPPLQGEGGSGWGRCRGTRGQPVSGHTRAELRSHHLRIPRGHRSRGYRAGNRARQYDSHCQAERLRQVDVAAADARVARAGHGHVRFHGEVLSTANALAVRQRMGYVIQGGGLFPHLTARENVELMARHLRWPGERIRARVDALVELTRFPPATLERFRAQLSAASGSGWG